jgi:hypothetical protein
MAESAVDVIGKVGDQGMLEKIGFVEFTTDLVKGVYRTIVEASMEQLSAYADFVSKVAKSLDNYQTEILGDDDQQEIKAYDYIKQVLGFTDSQMGNATDTTPIDTNELELTEEKATFLLQHFLGVTVTKTTSPPSDTAYPMDHYFENTTPKKIKLGDLKAFVIELLKKGVKESYDLIKTILKIGMQKVVVTSGEIHTKLTFHVDASDTYEKTASDYNQKSSSWGVGGGISAIKGPAGKTISKLIGGSISGGYSSSKLSVSVVNEKSTAATNITIDILGEVRILFKTETFPSIEV